MIWYKKVFLNKINRLEILNKALNVTKKGMINFLYNILIKDKHILKSLLSKICPYLFKI